MRIAQIAPLAESVPPKFYGGTERVVAWLVDELVELGHEVTLFASGDSRTRGNKNLFQPSYSPGSYLAFLGRLTAEKGPEDAIRIARAAQMPLRIAAKIPRAETAYFRKHLEPHLDDEKVRLIGEVNDASKQPFLAQAAALLFPIDWPEPFGLVMIEAMACGTPVIAYRSGSVPEVIDDGLTGFIVESEEEAVDAVNRLARLDRRKVRERFGERFSAHRMARAYESHYRQLVDGGALWETTE